MLLGDNARQRSQTAFNLCTDFVQNRNTLPNKLTLNGDRLKKVCPLF